MKKQVIARARYSLAYDGTFPELSLLRNHDGLPITEAVSSDNKTSKTIPDSYLSQNKWKLCLRRAYHPSLRHQHQENLQKARKEVSAVISEIQRARSLGRVPQQKILMKWILLLLNKRLLNWKKNILYSLIF